MRRKKGAREEVVMICKSFSFIFCWIFLKVQLKLIERRINTKNLEWKFFEGSVFLLQLVIHDNILFFLVKQII